MSGKDDLHSSPGILRNQEEDRAGPFPPCVVSFIWKTRGSVFFVDYLLQNHLKSLLQNANSWALLSD